MASKKSGKKPVASQSRKGKNRRGKSGKNLIRGSHGKYPFKVSRIYQLGIFLLPVLLYVQTLSFGYVMHDDDKMVLENVVLSEGFNLHTAFTTDAWFLKQGIELYRPLQSISYMVDHMIAGTAAWFYHLHNILIFGLSIYLLFVFLKLFFHDKVAVIGALVYGFNLLTPHAASWIAARGDLYLTVFALYNLICVTRYLVTSKMKWLGMATVAFAFALLSKESAIALVPIWILMIFLRGKKINWKTPGIWTVAMIGLFLGYNVLRGQAIATAGNMSVWALISNVRSLGEEALKFFIPVGFSVMPGYSVGISVVGAILLIGLFLLLWKRKLLNCEVVLIGGAMWLAPMLPSLAYEPSFAGSAYDYLDHRAFFTMMGFWIIILQVLVSYHLFDKKWIWRAGLGLLVLWGGINVIRSRVYLDGMVYHENALATNPNSGLAQMNYGVLLRQQERWEEALGYFESAKKLTIPDKEMHVRIAEVHFHLGDYDNTLREANLALNFDANYAKALEFRGSAYGHQQKHAEALADFEQALVIEPDNVTLISNAGIALKELGRDAQAIEKLNQAIDIDATNKNWLYHRGMSKGRIGQFPAALIDMEAAIALDPDYGAAWFFKGRALQAIGRINEACAAWRRAVDLEIEEAGPFLQQFCAG